jgi:ABC-type phosphate/phosphonate transport system substrate-binding protein
MKNMKEKMLSKVLLALGIITTLVLPLKSADASSTSMLERQALIKTYGENSGYVFGLFPGTVSVFNATSLLDRYLPLANYLSVSNKSLISFTPERNVEDFKQRIIDGDYPIIYVNAELGATAIDHGYEPLVKRADPITSVVVVNPNSSIKTIQDLNGKKVGAIPQAMVSSLAYYEFDKAHVAPNIEKGGGNGQEELLRNLGNQLLEGVILREETAKKAVEKEPTKYKIAFKTGTTIGFILMVKKDLPEDLKLSLKTSMLAIHQNTVEGNDILKGMDGKITAEFQETTMDELKSLEVMFKRIDELNKNKSTQTGDKK